MNINDLTEENIIIKKIEDLWERESWSRKFPDERIAIDYRFKVPVDTSRIKNWTGGTTYVPFQEDGKYLKILVKQFKGDEK